MKENEQACPSTSVEITSRIPGISQSVLTRSSALSQQPTGGKDCLFHHSSSSQACSSSNLNTSRFPTGQPTFNDFVLRDESFGNDREPLRSCCDNRPIRKHHAHEKLVNARADEEVQRKKAMPVTTENKSDPMTPQEKKILSDYVTSFLHNPVQSSDPASFAAEAEIASELNFIINKVGNKDSVCMEAIDIVLKHIYSDIEDENEQRQVRALNMIGWLVRQLDEVTGIVVETEGMKRVVDAMIDHRTSLALQKSGLVALLELTQTNIGRTAIVAAKGAECVCWSMKEFASSIAVQIHGATLLCNMAYGSPETKKRIGKIGGIDAIVDSMKAHPSDSTLQQRCCMALQTLTCDIRVNQWITGRALGIEAILNALRSFPEEASVLFHGCAALCNVCADEPDNRSRSADSGALELTISLLKGNVSQSDFVEHGLLFLRNMVTEDKAAQLRIGNEDGVHVVLGCLSEHLGSTTITEYGCSVLRYLFFVEQNRLRVRDHGGMNIFVRVLWESGKYCDVAESALYAVGNAIFDIPANKSSFARHGGIPALIAVMALHLDKVNIQEHGCRALRNLSNADGLNLRILEESGAVDCAMCAMIAYPQNGFIQEHGCAMLYNLAHEVFSLSRMKALNVEAIVETSLKSHPESPNVYGQAHALRRRLQRGQPVQRVSSVGLSASSGWLGSFSSSGNLIHSLSSLNSKTGREEKTRPE
jgi:hypothetical protein